ncbi:hypothetical protein PVAND_012935 [Polypedilum vanderplanki]|uniref:SRR1-like domain-containing protein n=1 Tax=Polypedilum vanderplanki TaxID=319348 RepID=A0A9J6CP40_POLVA|nr:hypothetical protein PVAND_012935 [Polypedilum vanderplanki]
MSDFILVTKSKRKSKKTSKLRVDRSLSPIEIDEDKVINQIREIKIDLESSDFFKKSFELFAETIKNRLIEEIICLGIGKISECIIAKHQFAFILIIKEKFNIQYLKFYDPIHSLKDKNILKSFDCEILKENKEAKYIADKLSLFYLPHCPKQITNNLLYKNWNAASLNNLIIICNSFKSIIEATPERFLRPNAHYIIEIDPFVNERELENCYKFTDIFNDFSIHTFDKVAELEKDFWENNPEPIYSSEDLEFVKEKNGRSEDIERNFK